MSRRRIVIGLLAIVALALVSLFTYVQAEPRAATLVVMLLVATNAGLALELRRRQRDLAALGTSLQRALEKLDSSGAAQTRTHAQMLSSLREEIAEIRRLDGERHARTRKSIQQVQAGLDDVRQQLRHGRKLAGERHARTRESLTESSKIGKSMRDQLARIELAEELRARRVLGILESARLQAQDRHEELVEKSSSDPTR